MQTEPKTKTGFLGGLVGIKTIALIPLVGLIISTLATIATNPLAEDSILGMPGWPPALGRQALFTLWVFTFYLPFMYLMYRIYISHQQWLVPRNEVYDPKKTYKVWTTRRVIEGAVAAGFYLAASMIKVPVFQQLDFMFVAGGFTAVYWGGPVTFVMSMVGGTLRSIAGGFADYYDLIGNMMVDGMYWMLLAVFWRRFVEDAKGKKHVLGIIAAIAMVQIIFFINWFVVASVISWSWSTFVPFVIGGALSYAIVIFIGLPVGIIAGDSAIRLSKRL